MTGGHTAPLSDADGDAGAHESGNAPGAADAEARAVGVRAARRAGGDHAGATAWRPSR